MDLIEIPLAELGYGVLALEHDASGRLLHGEAARLGEQVAASRLVYGSPLGGPKLARAHDVPYILILENDLQTQITLRTAGVPGLVQRATRTLGRIRNYAMVSIPDMRGAHSVHCNGFPMYDQSKWFNSNRLLYFDSRMSADLIIPEDRLNARLNQRTSSRPLRLLFSGRYDRVKGSDDAVRVAVECGNRGLDIEMHCYGQGDLRGEMERLAKQAPARARILIHDAIPYPDLVEVSRTFDLFVCCHVQGDPSCTYLEAFGSGLPIAGYANRMWRRLCGESRVGFATPTGQPDAVAASVQQLASDSATLAEMSMRARAFAVEHSFEREFKRRTESMNAVLEH
jgi:glycosyltransferase involved in cell wall biosynthesis